METVITKVQKFTAMALAIMLTVVMLVSTVHLGWLIGTERVSLTARLAFMAVVTFGKSPSHPVTFVIR